MVTSTSIPWYSQNIPPSHIPIIQHKYAGMSLLWYIRKRLGLGLSLKNGMKMAHVVPDFPVVNQTSRGTLSRDFPGLHRAPSWTDLLGTRLSPEDLLWRATRWSACAAPLEMLIKHDQTHVPLIKVPCLAGEFHKWWRKLGGILTYFFNTKIEIQDQQMWICGYAINQDCRKGVVFPNSKSGFKNKNWCTFL